MIYGYMIHRRRRVSAASTSRSSAGRPAGRIMHDMFNLILNDTMTPQSFRSFDLTLITYVKLF